MAFGKAIQGLCGGTEFDLGRALCTDGCGHYGGFAGLKRDVSRVERYLSQWDMLEPGGFHTYREAPVIFRSARAKGIAVTIVEALIAPMALEHGATLFTLDRDFTRISSIIRLPLMSFEYLVARLLHNSINNLRQKT